jgi:hypothetical protein
MVTKLLKIKVKILEFKGEIADREIDRESKNLLRKQFVLTCGISYPEQ